MLLIVFISFYLLDSSFAFTTAAVFLGYLLTSGTDQ